MSHDFLYIFVVFKKKRSLMKKLFAFLILLSVMGLAACDGSGTNKNVDDCDENPADCQVPEDDAGTDAGTGSES